MITEFRKGGWCYDAIGRRWKVIEIQTNGDFDIMIIRKKWHLFGKYIAITEYRSSRGIATVLLEDGFTTIYKED